MMIEIESDVFDMVNRIKEIDDGYRIMLNLKTGRLELHNIYQTNTFCFNIKNNEILPSLIDDIFYSQSRHIDNIISDIDKYNSDIDTNTKDNAKDYTTYTAKEIFDFCNNSSKDYDIKKAFKNIWR